MRALTHVNKFLSANMQIFFFDVLNLWYHSCFTVGVFII
jgi:hypothetical protein